MHYRQIIRTNPTTGRLERPWRNRSHEFVLGDPSQGKVRHHEAQAVKVDNYGEALELVEGGFSIRMSDGKAPPSLVTPGSLRFIDEPAARLDDLWTYSMPDPPFSHEELDRDLSMTLLAKAGEIHWMANPEAAKAFIGFPFEIDEVESGSVAELIDLDRFNFTRVARNAFEAAFRTGAARPLSEEDADELELLIGATAGHTCSRYPSPAARPKSPLYRTMRSAYLRWKISEGALFDNKLDQSAVEDLAILSGMSEQAVRNSLNKEKLSPVAGKIDYDAIIVWLEHRRDFVPLRECERPQSKATWDAIASLQASSIGDGFAAIRARLGMGAQPSLRAAAEAGIKEAMLHGRMPSASDLRTYARAAGLAIDTFVLNFKPASEQAYAD